MGRDDVSQFWSALTALAGLLVAFGAMAYVLGLLAMWIPASKATEDFILSWSAVSLVPRTTVAGVGVRWSLVGGHLLYVVLSIPLWILVLWVWDGLSAIGISKPSGSVRTLAYVGIGALSIGLVLAFVYVKVIIAFASDLPLLRHVLMPIILVVVLSPLILELIKSGSITWQMTKRVLWIAAFFILLNFVTSIFVIGFVGPLGRPVAEVTGDNELRDGTTGFLWTHTEGFWYVFDEDYNLCAISDEDVEIVRIREWPGKDKDPNLTSCP